MLCHCLSFVDRMGFWVWSHGTRMCSLGVDHLVVYFAWFGWG